MQACLLLPEPGTSKDDPDEKLWCILLVLTHLVGLDFFKSCLKLADGRWGPVGGAAPFCEDLQISHPQRFCGGFNVWSCCKSGQTEDV